MNEKLYSIAQDLILYLKGQFFPSHFGKGLLYFAFALILFFLFFESLIFLLFEFLLLSSLPAWGASLMITAGLFTLFIILILLGKRALKPKIPLIPPSEKLNINDIVIAFVDGFLRK
ncbi:phage holin family protein [Chlamydiales bacterium]|nr:phage holin family protein [Chlamydiales bacterium]